MEYVDNFYSPEELKNALGRQDYIASDEIATIMYLSQQLGKPLLTEGPQVSVRQSWPKPLQVLPGEL
jgi:hypothetical protein